MRTTLCIAVLGAALATSSVRGDVLEDVKSTASDAVDAASEGAAAAADTVKQTVIEQPTYQPSSVKGFFVEQFDDLSRWSPSAASVEKVAGTETFQYVGQWTNREPQVYPGIKGDKGLVVASKAAHHAISTTFEAPLDPAGKTLVVQYEVKLEKGLECGGAYMKLLTLEDAGIAQAEYSDKTPYTIMFGPDKCGSTSKVHFIFRHKNPNTGVFEEKHLKIPPQPRITKTTTLYTLITRPDQTYEIKIDGEFAKSGSLLEDFDPAVNPAKEISDPEDKKPSDWVDDAKIVDPDASKPDDWDEDALEFIPDESATKPDTWLDDEPLTIPDPSAEKPEEWDDEEDGDWIAPVVTNPKCEDPDVAGCGEWRRPTIANPAYKGKWYAPMIDNPLYKGIWAPRKIANPDYFEDKTPANFNKIGGIGFELWTMQEDILFDNIYIGHSEKDAELFAKQTFHVKKPVETAAEEVDKPKPAAADPFDQDVPSIYEDPIGHVKVKFQKLIDLAVVDPIGALKTYPDVTAAFAAVIAGFVGVLAIIFGLFAASPKIKEETKKAANKAAAKKDEVVAAASDKADDATATAREAKDEGAQKRKTRSSGAADE
ncbi:uncharacterized protein L969DRAFT_24275 [Mixia osmundae IAM 14324]|uniref:Calnexin n=1 Tax=Mixia osmundae (strain CBS 9802 / IAM 14324 / JCM 22182 / KY 12970) TaxID=764103 RepID=G7E216_MIXOS|nr:uncharacterized protein L969DRAFT_24275 [Mixia osmundae IAM 14324]KEI38687.1 hypothetical protein L969DRAFT_24275 [Mixia osmundae IAM 14324]GAA96853.1 hypothetical protein E5Q_03526 [Mixia osmundae IAM 14324]